MKEQWLNNLKERSEAFERKAPDGLWDGVMQSLEERGVVRKKRNIMPLVLRRGMVAAAVLLSAVIGFVVLHNDEISLQKNMPKESKAVAETESVEKTASVEVVHHTLALQQPIINDRSSKYVQMAAEETKAPEQQFGDSTFVVKDSDVANKSVEEQDVRNAHSVMDNYAERQRHAGREIPGMYRGDKTSEGGNGKWSAGIYASNMTGNDASAIGYRNFRMGTNPFGNMPKQETWTTNAMANIMFNNLNKSQAPLAVAFRCKCQVFTDEPLGLGKRRGLHIAEVGTYIGRGARLLYIGTNYSLLGNSAEGAFYGVAKQSFQGVCKCRGNDGDTVVGQG